MSQSNSDPIMHGVRVIEVAIYGFVPSAGAVLADWGADVVKIEHPEAGDPMRGLAAWGVPPDLGGVTRMWEIFNRGKRSVGIDLRLPEGQDVLHTLVAEADVFLTNFLPSARQRLRIDVEHIVERNPAIIYARGSGYGPKGPDAAQGGFDGISYWARTGASMAAMPPGADAPIMMPGPAFGDIQAGAHLAGGVAAALFRRERTGRGAVVDVSLLGAGMWAMQPALVSAFVSGTDQMRKLARHEVSNPLANVSYRTADDRFIALSMLESDKYWARLVELIDRDALRDTRFATATSRHVNVAECVDALDRIFAERPLAEWVELLRRQDGQWSVVRQTTEVLGDEQAVANRYVQDVAYGDGVSLPMVAAPVQFEEEAPDLTPAPELGAHTDDVLLATGLTWEEIVELKIAGVVS